MRALRAALVAITAVGFANCRRPASPPGPPTIDAVMTLPSMGPPKIVPQSLGGEYRAYPNIVSSARGLAFDLRNVGDPNQIAVSVDNVPVARGVTTGTLNVGDPPRFSVAADSYGYRLTLLLPLFTGIRHTRQTIGIAGAANGAVRNVVVDDAELAVGVRPEPSDVFFGPGQTQYYWWQPIVSGMLDPGNIVARDVSVSGWLLSEGATFNPDGTLPTPRPAAPLRTCFPGQYCEDIHYFLMLDPSSIARVYGRSDRVSSMDTARLPGVSSGDPFQRDPMPFSVLDSLGGSVGSPSAVTINSFAVPNDSCGFHTKGTLPDPFASYLCLKGEQPIWHITMTPPTSATYFGRHINGLGPPPVGWTIRFTETYDQATAYAYSPAGGIDMASRTDLPTQLRFGDYVTVKATLFQDAPHGPPGCFPRATWHSNWLELHSIDWIARAAPPSRATTAARVANCVEVGTGVQSFDRVVAPPPAWFAPRNAGDTLHYCTLVDERFTTPGNLSGLQIGPGPDPDTVRARFTLNPSNQSAAFTASIVMWFAPATDQTLDVACYGSVSS